MTIKEVVQYITHTPYNTNKTILIQILENLIVSHGGSIDDDPDVPSVEEVIYDGGIES